MTENKRFNLAYYDNYDGTFSIQDKLYSKENKHLHSLDEIINLMNELNEKYTNELNLRETLQQELQKIEKENDELKQENKQLQFRIIDMLDFIKENDGVTRQEMQEWWNNKLEFYYKFIKSY